VGEALVVDLIRTRRKRKDENGKNIVVAFINQGKCHFYLCEICYAKIMYKFYDRLLLSSKKDAGPETLIEV
jgi:hypothetical protein